MSSAQEYKEYDRLEKQEGFYNIRQLFKHNFEEEEEQNVDDRDAPNIYPYKKCCDCGDRKSCGSYDDDNNWFCEDCNPDED